VRVEEYACCVNKLRQNGGVETIIWRQIVTSQTAHTKYKWPLYAIELFCIVRCSCYTVWTYKV